MPNPAVEGQFLTQDSDYVGVKWRLGTADTTGSLVTFSSTRTSSDGAAIDPPDSRWDSSAAFPAIRGWRCRSAARARIDGANQGFVLSSLNWSFNRKD